MLLSDLQRDAVLVTDVAGRVEAALADLWGLKQFGLRNQIDALRHKRVRKGVIRILHQLRQWRNSVVHHPRTCLPDYERFRTFSEQVLPILERSSGADDFADQVRARLGQDIEAYVDAKMAAAFENLDQILNQDVEADIDAKLTAAFDELGNHLAPSNRG